MDPSEAEAAEAAGVRLGALLSSARVLPARPGDDARRGSHPGRHIAASVSSVAAAHVLAGVRPRTIRPRRSSHPIARVNCRVIGNEFTFRHDTSAYRPRGLRSRASIERPRERTAIEDADETAYQPVAMLRWRDAFIGAVLGGLIGGLSWAAWPTTISPVAI